MKNIFYHLFTEYYNQDEVGVFSISNDFTKEDIDEIIQDLAIENALSYGIEDDEELENVYGYWREATKEDLEDYEPIVL